MVIKMKKLRTILMVALMMLSLTACADGNGDKSSSNKTASGQNDKIPSEGYIEMLDYEKGQAKSFYSESPYHSLVLEEYKKDAYPGLSELLLALKGGKVDWAFLSSDTAKYVKHENSDLTLFVDPSIVYSYAMATRGEDTTLATQLDSAIAALKKDGTIAALEDKYIYSAQGAPTETIKLTEFKGAPTIRIGLTGNLPPFDYTSADGTPSGFNTAFAKALGDYLKVNIELTTVDVGARLTALSTKKIDVIFWMIVDAQSDTLANTDGVCITQVYHKSYGAVLTKDYPYDQILKHFGLLDD